MHIGLFLLFAVADAARLPSWKPSFPPLDVIQQCDPSSGSACVVVATWLEDNVPDMKPPDPTLTPRQKFLARMSACEYIAARRAGNVTCVEYTTALVKRMVYYNYMNQWMYWDNFPLQTDYILAQAAAMDTKVSTAGVEAIAPLYGLPFPVKGTVATTDFPSSAGSGVLHDYRAAEDAAIVRLLRERNAVIMGKTNVPEFACSLITANYANGRALNPYDHRLTTGGSSGGSASAVASYLAPIALSEDTGGSTRHPAAQNANFGYDPSRNHFPNIGNPGLTYTCDQIGLNARELGDIMLLDAALLGTEAEHAAAAKAAEAAGALRVGLPQEPFVRWRRSWVAAGERCEGGEGGGGGSCGGEGEGKGEGEGEGEGEAFEAAAEVVARLKLAASVLAASNVTLIREEWAPVGGGDSSATGMSVADYYFHSDSARCEGFSARGQMATWVQGSLAPTAGAAILADSSTSVRGGAAARPAARNASTGGGGWGRGEGEGGARVSNAEIVADMQPIPGGHNPRGCFVDQGCSESAFRHSIAMQADVVRVWNSYFDAHNIDVVMTPGQPSNAVTYTDVANASVPVRAATAAAAAAAAAAAGLPIMDAIGWFFSYFKTIPVPKLAVPAGLDAQGRPLGLLLWGRAVPPEQLYNDSFARTFDLRFLYQARALVAVLHAVPELQRQPAPLVADLFTQGD
jgi:Asp-tRNA(Asn)/Glu-tRNA(Gln) amidotransferase A subunit family amidase